MRLLLLAALLTCLLAHCVFAQSGPGPDSRARPYGPKFNEPGMWKRAQAVAPFQLTDGATIAIDSTQSTSFTVTLGGNRTILNPVGVMPGQTLILYLTQDGTGSRTVTWGSSFKFIGGTKPTLSTAVGATDMISCHALSATFLSCVAAIGLS